VKWKNLYCVSYAKCQWHFSIIPGKPRKMAFTTFYSFPQSPTKVKIYKWGKEVQSKPISQNGTTKFRPTSSISRATPPWKVLLVCAKCSVGPNGFIWFPIISSFPRKRMLLCLWAGETARLKQAAFRVRPVRLLYSITRLYNLRITMLHGWSCRHQEDFPRC